MFLYAPGSESLIFMTLISKAGPIQNFVNFSYVSDHSDAIIS